MILLTDFSVTIGYSLSCYRCYSNAGHSRPDCETISSDQDKYLSECTEDEPNCLTAVREGMLVQIDRTCAVNILHTTILWSFLLLPKCMIFEKYNF